MSSVEDFDDVMIDEAFDDFRGIMEKAMEFLADALRPLIESSNDVAYLELTKQLELSAIVAARLRDAGLPTGEETSAAFLMEVLCQALRQGDRSLRTV